MKLKALSIALVARSLVAGALLAGTAVVAAHADAPLSDTQRGEARALAASIESAVTQSQANAQSQGLSSADALAAEKAAIQQVIAQSGASPDVALLAMAEARRALEKSGTLTPVSVMALNQVFVIVQTAAIDSGTGYASATGGPGYGAPLGAPPSAGGGGGGSAYRNQ
jgi:hypothetical protein